MPRNSPHSFAQVPSTNAPRSSFDRSSGLKTTMDAGLLIPVFVDEALPGDTFNLSMSAFGRLATPLFPYMDNAYLDSFFFAVPNRLLWSNWERFMGAQDDPGDSIDFLLPQVTAPTGGWTENSMGDYFGVPTLVDPLPVSALHFRAYNLIWNEWFRDENLQNSLTVPLDDGPDADTDYVLQKRGKRHDYFTSCLPWPQKGAAVDLPLGTQAPVQGILVPTAQGLSAGPTNFRTVNSASESVSNYYGPTVTNIKALDSDTTLLDVYADLTEATAATINELRQAFQVQRMLEKDARGGTRYTEIVRSHFNVVSPDARLQRPEFLGGGSTPVNVNPVAQTGETGTTPQGNLAAFATVNPRSGFTKSFTEHCVIIGLVCLRADLTYQQGLNRMWSRRTREDYYWPSLSHIGEQAVLNKEIFADGSANDDAAFGYQERYGEYRYKPSMLTSAMRSNAATSLDSWHLAQDFSALPALNASFIEEDPPFDRVVATPSEPHLLLDAHFSLRCARPMPLFGVPGLIDHF